MTCDNASGPFRRVAGLLARCGGRVAGGRRLRQRGLRYRLRQHETGDRRGGTQAEDQTVWTHRDAPSTKASRIW